MTPSDSSKQNKSDEMISRYRSFAKSSNNSVVRYFAIVAKAPYRPPPPPPPDEKRERIRKITTYGSMLLVLWIYLKPWDHDSILGDLSGKPQNKDSAEAAVVVEKETKTS